MIQDLLYLVSSHDRYGIPLERLLRSMEFVRADIMVVRGGSGCDVCHVNAAGYSCHVTHNSFDYTALIHAIEKGELENYQHAFLLHDTMEFSHETSRLICQADPEMDATACYPGGQCNLCLFRTDYLMSKKDLILSMKNCTKQQAVDFEGVLWKDAPRKALYPNATVDVLGEEKVYGGLTRRIERYNAIQLLKFKGSWGQDMPGISSRVMP